MAKCLWEESSYLKGILKSDVAEPLVNTQLRHVELLWGLAASEKPIQSRCLVKLYADVWATKPFDVHVFFLVWVYLTHAPPGIIQLNMPERPA